MDTTSRAILIALIFVAVAAYLKNKNEDAEKPKTVIEQVN